MDALESCSRPLRTVGYRLQRGANLDFKGSETKPGRLGAGLERLGTHGVSQWLQLY